MAKYHSGHQIKKNMGAKHLGRMGERCVAFRILVDKPEGNRPLGRPRLRWEDNIKGYRVLAGKHEGKRPLGRTRRRWEDNITINLPKVGLEVWTDLAQYRDR